MEIKDFITHYKAIKSVRNEGPVFTEQYVQGRIDAMQSHLTVVESWLKANAMHKDFLKTAEHRTHVLVDLGTYRQIRLNLSREIPSHGYPDAMRITGTLNGVVLHQYVTN